MVDHIFARYAQGHKNIKFVLSLEEVNMIFMKYNQKIKQATKRFLSGEPSTLHMTEFVWANRWWWDNTESSKQQEAATKSRAKWKSKEGDITGPRSWGTWYSWYHKEDSFTVMDHPDRKEGYTLVFPLLLPSILQTSTSYYQPNLIGSQLAV